MDLLRDILIRAVELPRDGHILVVYGTCRDRDDDFRRISPVLDMYSSTDKVGRFMGRVIKFISISCQRHQVRGLRFSEVVINGGADLSLDDYDLLNSRIIPREGDK